ncbi:MAG: TetR/AcrR family transcriptional regulator [Prevotella sp.]|nr:TetR/AcrR family transcriptional regulator [Prevotella sp.]
MYLFKHQGVKSVKMDDISRALGISKRTLYETYDNKEQLLLEGVKMDNEQRRQELEDFINEKPRNEIEIMVKFVHMQLAELKDINPLFFRELTRYKPIVAYLEQCKAVQTSHTISFIQKGVEHGYFKSSLNYDIVLEMGEAVMNHVMENKVYERFPMQEIFHNYVSVLMRGYCTDKGIVELQKLF